MVEIYLSRYNAEARGDNVRWEIGEKATFIGSAGDRHRVTIRSDAVLHAGSEGKLCREVSFNDEGGTMYCVPAERLYWD